MANLLPMTRSPVLSFRSPRAAAAAELSPADPVARPAGRGVAPLSAVVIAKDEAPTIRRCLESLAFADEILVVDSGSTDGTLEVAREMGARVVEHPFEGYGPQKRFAVAQASHDWVLSVDADEEVTPELAAALRALLSGPPPAAAAFRLRFTIVFMGRRFTRGAYANDWHVRLLDRRRAQFDEAQVHERVVAEGEVGTLRAGVMLHHTARDLEHYLVKMNRYSTRGAEQLFLRGKSRSAVAVFFAGPFYFFREWLLRGSVLNGLPGLVWAMVHSLEPIMKYLKLLERRARP